MIWFEVFLLAVALSIDAFIVSFSCGLVVNKNKKKNGYKMAAANGFAQFAMPLLGWLGTKTISGYVQAFDHWIVFFVFLILGLKFIKDAMEEKASTCELPRKNITFKVLLIAAFATSIDAFVSGVTLYFMPVSIIFAAMMIGIVTFINSLIGFRLTHIFRKIPTKYIEIFAGVILITLGSKVLIEHILNHGYEDLLKLF
ncbi:MAG: manganese efflux pump MntP family protein [Lactobacillaceae bacterium]|jgi:putative Mn2+ efflux pump MntP|nr:manganese efflux pump MntP family protein [Lactobacillaceae bacterium]